MPETSVGKFRINNSEPRRKKRAKKPHMLHHCLMRAGAPDLQRVKLELMGHYVDPSVSKVDVSWLVLLLVSEDISLRLKLWQEPCMRR